MKRDEMDESEAQAEVTRFKDRIKEHVERGGSPFDCEEWLHDEYGLEPDYLEPILHDLEIL